MAGWTPAKAREKKDGEENQGRSLSGMGCWGEREVLALGGLVQDQLLLPVLSRLSFFLLWSTSTVPTR